MARKISRRIKTLRGFVAWAEQFTDGKYLFRGVSKQSYKLEASAYRRLPEGDKRKPHELRNVTSLQGDESEWQAKRTRIPKATRLRKQVNS